VLVAAGFALIRAQDWAGCWLLEAAWLGGNPVSGVWAVPAWVPALVGLVALGHLFSGLRGVRCGVLRPPAPLRAGAYVAAVVLVVAFGQGVTRAFIYFQF
jgi:hypothetical protein